MDFMQPQIREGKWCEIDTDTGTWWVPKEDVTNESPEALIWFTQAIHYHEHRFIEGFGARLSAPGFLDCTEWTVFETEEEAQTWMEELTDGGTENC